MSDLRESIKVSDLPDSTTISDNDIFLLSKNSSGMSSKKVNSSVIKDYVYNNISSDIVDKINECLPLSGGEESSMDGTIYTENEIALKKKGEDPLVLIGGEDDDNSSKMKLYSNNTNGFELEATRKVGENSFSSKLEGQYDGKLTWDGKNIVRSVNGIEADDNGNTIINYVLSANCLTTPRTISLIGDVTGSTSFNGSNNVTISAEVKDDSHNHTISNIVNLQAQLNNKLNTSNRVDLSSNLNSTTNVPNCKSVIDYLKGNYLALSTFVDPGDNIEKLTENLQNLGIMMNSMMSETNMTLYIDQDYGNDSNDGSKKHPLRTINEAIDRANKRRFIGNSRCFIYLKSDIKLDYIDNVDLILNHSSAGFCETIYKDDNTTIKGYKKIIIYHPDLVQTKYIQISGYNGITKSIKFNTYADAATHRVIMSIYCRASFNYLKFEGGLDPDELLSNGFNIPTYATYALFGEDGAEVGVYNCQFYGCYTGIYGLTAANNLKFDYCINCITTNRACTIHPYLIINNCRYGVTCSSNKVSLNTDTPHQFSIAVKEHPFRVSSGGAIVFNATAANFYNLKFWPLDSYNQIIPQSDGEYRPNNGYEDVYLKFGKLKFQSPLSATNTINLSVEDIEYDSIENLMKALFNFSDDDKRGFMSQYGYIGVDSSLHNISVMMDYGENFDWNGNKK